MGSESHRVERLLADTLRGKPWLREPVDSLGRLSGVAQHLSGPITSYDRCAYTGNMVLYVLFNSSNEAVGLLRLGMKQLFLVDVGGQELRQVNNCMCVLDFFVKQQKQGLGKILFEAMLEAEQREPASLALDRPSEKFLGFMRKHYGLKKFRTQSNKFLVFDEFWTSQTVGNGGPPGTSAVAGDRKVRVDQGGRVDELGEASEAKRRFEASATSTAESLGANTRSTPVVPLAMDFRRKRIPYN